jgi:hypothetical protein
MPKNKRDVTVTPAMRNAVQYCCGCSKELTCRRVKLDYNCVNCDRPEAELVQTIHGVYVCVNTEKCSRAGAGTDAAPRPFICETCYQGDVASKDGVMLAAKDITLVLVGPGDCECGKRYESSGVTCAAQVAGKDCGGARIWRSRYTRGCSKQCHADVVVTGTTTELNCSCGKTTERLVLNTYREPARRRQRSPTPPPAVKVEVKKEPTDSDVEEEEASTRQKSKSASTAKKRKKKW